MIFNFFKKAISPKWWILYKVRMDDKETLDKIFFVSIYFHIFYELNTKAFNKMSFFESSIVKETKNCKTSNLSYDL